MTSEAITVLNIQAVRLDSKFYASSEDIFGLHICASSFDELKSRLVEGVKWLYKQNKGLDVEVRIATPVAEFPAPRSKAQVLPEQLIVAQAA